MLYVQPYAEGSAKILDWEKLPNSPRFGMPVKYQLTLEGMDGTTLNLPVHYTRILHIVERPKSSNVYGTPRLKRCYNRLIDAEKVAGGSGEMFWRGARPGRAVTSEEPINNPQVKEELQAQLDEFDNGLRRTLKLLGFKIQEFQQQVSSPKEHLDSILRMISISEGIPKRILEGSERGELASSQDGQDWGKRIRKRQVNFCEAKIIRPFIDYLVKFKVLPVPADNKYEVKWVDPMPTTRSEEASIALKEAQAIQAYVTSPGALDVMPLEAFLRFVLRWDKNKIAVVKQLLEEQGGLANALDAISAAQNPSGIEEDNPEEGKAISTESSGQKTA